MDFIQRVEGLTLPEAIQRLDGGGHRAVFEGASRPVAARRPKSAPLPPRDPALLTAGCAILRRRAPAFQQKRGNTWPREA